MKNIELRKETKEIILHCTATPKGHNFSTEEIRQWHKANGWKDIGYHWVIELDGSIHEGRPENLIGSHCKGHNNISVGVAYVGGLDEHGKFAMDTRTTAQCVSMQKLVAELLERYPNATVHGHNEFANKECPCFRINNGELFKYQK